MNRLVLILFSLFIIGLMGRFNYSSAQHIPEKKENILKLMEEIFNQIPRDLTEIDPSLDRIAIYRLETDKNNISTSMREHFESRLVELLGTLQRPAVVSLPEMNTLKITSTDSSFSIINALPSPEELWRVGRRLRVDAFLEGNLVYMPKKALFLDLRLNRTGTNEVLWAKSYSAYEKEIKLPSMNPLNKSLNAGIEIFQIDFDSAADSLLHSDFNNNLIQYSIYFGLYQYATANSRLRYELRFGLSFLSEGVKLRNTSFNDNSFYSVSSNGTFIKSPISYNFRSMLYSTLVENKNNQFGDWLSVYFSLTRYFTINMPDLTGLGAGIRIDLISHFSLSSGFSMILGPEFDSLPVKATNESVRLKVNGIHYELLLLQITF
ncbi:MAG: hypothetical protein ACE5JB_06795 [bacterium]